MYAYTYSKIDIRCVEVMSSKALAWVVFLFINQCLGSAYDLMRIQSQVRVKLHLNLNSEGKSFKQDKFSNIFFLCSRTQSWARGNFLASRQ